MRDVFILAVAAALASEATLAAPSPLDPEAAIAHSQDAIGRELGDLGFRNRDDEPVSLAQFRGAPLVVNMVFTACAESCPIIVQTLYSAVEIAQDSLGSDSFTVVTVGFDSDADTPARMHAFASAQGVDLPYWHFLSGDAESVQRLADTLGFLYVPSPRGFDHLAQTSVIDATGRVYRQVYGAEFTAPALVEPLLALVYGNPEGSVVEQVIDRVRLFCTFYDPASGRYRFDYSIFIGATIGGISLLGFALVLVRAWRRTSRPTSQA